MAITVMNNARYASGYLSDKRVQVKGFGVEYKSPGGNVTPVFNSFMHELNQDVIELPLANYIILRDLGKPVTAIPAFPTVFFPLLGPMVNRKAGIKSVDDLIGKRVGVSGFAFNPATWVRSMFAHQYDLPLESITWVEGEPNSMSKVPYGRSRRFKTESAGNIMEMLEKGELDAVIMSDGGIDPTDTIDRLFQDPMAEIRKFYEATGVFPINSVVTMTNEVLKTNPGLDRALSAAYRVAWRQYVEEAGDTKHMGLSVSELKKTGMFPPPQGFASNRKSINWMIHALFEQGLIKRLWEPEELFQRVD
jgi:4,5-dihydroxyphthalate decarboxylase